MNVFELGEVPLSSKSLEHEYLFYLTLTMHAHVIKLMPGQINALELMPSRISRISALALMPDQIGRVW